MAILKLVGVEKSFGGVKALAGVNLEVGEGELLAVIGPNGAGKTTLINVVSGLIRPDRGKVYFRGVDVTNKSPQERVKMGIARSFQLPQLFPGRTVRFNVEVALAARMGTTLKPLKSEEAEALLRDFGLWEKRDRTVEELSEGERKLLDVLLAMALKPSLILLDEPTSSVSEKDKIPFMEFLTQRLKGISAIMVEHDLDIVKSFAHRVAVMQSGSIIALTQPHEAERYVV